MRLIVLLIFITVQNSIGQINSFDIKEASLSIQMPNSEWNLVKKSDGNYVFKRNSIVDNEGREIVPAIMVFIEDAKDYDQDVTNFSIAKRLQFQGKGIVVDKIMTHEDKDYPISYKNSYLTMCSYSDRGLDHILYMIHVITKDNKGIQIYMDMTKSVAEKYSSEFWSAMKSIKENG